MGDPFCPKLLSVIFGRPKITVSEESRITKERVIPKELDEAQDPSIEAVNTNEDGSEVANNQTVEEQVEKPVEESSLYLESSKIVPVERKASFVFVTPLEGFEISEVFSRLIAEREGKNNYIYEIFPEKNIIAVIDNSGSSHSDMRMFLDDYSKGNAREKSNALFKYLGGSRLDRHAEIPTVINSKDLSRFGNGVEIHAQILGGMVITKYEPIDEEGRNYTIAEDGRIRTPVAGYMHYQWTLEGREELQIVGRNGQLVR